MVKPVNLLANDLDCLVGLVKRYLGGLEDGSQADLIIVFSPARPNWFIQGKPDDSYQPIHTTLYTTLPNQAASDDKLLRVYLEVMVRHGLPFATEVRSAGQYCRVIWSKSDEIIERSDFRPACPPCSEPRLIGEVNRCARLPLDPRLRGVVLSLAGSFTRLVGLPYHGMLPATVYLTKDENGDLAQLTLAVERRLDDAEPFITRYTDEQRNVTYLWA